VNGVNEAALEALEKGPAAQGAIAGLLLVDPFLRLRDARLALAEAGVSRVANFPTVQLIDGDTARAFDSANVGAAREVDALAAFRGAGFETVAFAATLQTAQAMLPHGPSMLVLHPGLALADWRERTTACLGLVRMIAVLRGETDLPLLVYRPHGFGHELDQAADQADGLAQIED
jgi:predicted TIM-barrel enzyme